RPMLTSVFTLGTDVLNFNTEMKRSVIAGSLFDNYRLTYYQQADKDWRRQYRYDRDSRTEVKSRLEYIRKYEKIGQTDGLLKPYLAFDHLYGTGNHPQYRLDRLAEWSDLLDWGTGSMGMLPPVAWKSVCLDMLNSYYSQQKENSGEAGMKWSHKIKLPGSTTIQIEAGEALQYTRKVLDYQRESRYYRVVRDGIFARHQASVRWKKENRDGRNWLPEVQLRYQGTPSMPSLTQYLPIRDESDPLNLFIGNAELKDRFLHEVGHTFNLQQTKKHYAFNTEMVYRRVHNDIATRSLYDERTGVRTYCPVNTSRTHGLRGRASFSTPLDKKRRVYLSAAFEADYRQCENLSFLLQETDVASGLLRNMAYRPQLSLRATIGSVVRANASWYTAFSRLRQPGTENRYRQTNLFLNATGKLPWDLRLGTTLRSYIYAGNSQSTLNGPLTLWDATLSKEFKGLAITLKVHDILARSHSFTTTTDSFQRTERSADILPRYAMLTLTYNFNWTEKRK
ncbi:MAG TPA: outer membrane beta-barrel protein, partial [Alloprevotella sp.]|nr:outer membrane beta-barrel protein [Alloprevotella sp.]